MMRSMNGEAAITAAFFAAFASVAWSAAFAWARWLARPREQAPSIESERRLARLEMSVDAIAIEIERLGEAQRYTAKLLEERLPAARPALPRAEHPKSVTPH